MDSWTKGLLRLREPGVHIRCREDDLHLVQAVIQSACEIYPNKANMALSKVTVDDKVFLPGPPQPRVHGFTWYYLPSNCLLFFQVPLMQYLIFIVCI
jgi:hypothetical protein